MVHEPFRYSQVSAALPGSSQRVVTTSESDLQTELDVPRPVGADHRVGGDHIRRARHKTKTVGQPEVVVERIDQQAPWDAEVRVVQHIEELAAELHAEPLFQPEVLHHREVPVPVVGPTEDIAPRVPETLSRTGRRLENLGNRDRAVDGEVGNGARRADQIVAIAEFTRQADVILEVHGGVGGARLKDDDRIDLPALEHLPPAFFGREIISQRQGEAMADVEVAIPALQVRAQAVLRLRRPIQRNIIDRMRPCIPADQGQAVPDPLREADLQAMVDGRVIVPQEVDEPEEWKATIEGPAVLLAVPASDLRSRVGIHLVDVADAVKFDASVANVADLERSGTAERLLNIEIPGHDVRRPKVASDPKDVTGRAACARVAVQIQTENGTGGRPVQSLTSGPRYDRAVNIGADRGGRDRVYADRGRVIVDAVLTQEDRQMRDFIYDGSAGANHCLALAKRIPGDAEPRRDIVVVGVVNRADVDAELLEAHRRIEVAQKVVALTNG